ncbi:MAG TPA: ATP-binding cassette domain-containing protein [Bacteroidota bacterium]|nr:ATP-binding cassette domain-containing protein [Bacteroidota bacterium]
MISIREIRKSFNERPVLRGVSIDAQDRETLVVLGKSGCGKSVMLKMIVGLMKPDSGQILVDGSNVLTLTYPRLRELRFKFGLLFQGAALFDSLTVGENIALALRRGRAKEELELNEDEIAERVSFALEVVGLGAIENTMPADLSGGMKKRVGLARAIVPRPRYMLYDEPTTGLDMETADEINLLINDLRSKLGVTSIVVTHDIHSAFVVGDRFAILDRGMTLMTGTRQEVEKSTNEDVQKYISSSISNSRVIHA